MRTWISRKMRGLSPTISNSKPHKKRNTSLQLEALEERVLLTVASMPNQLLPAGVSPRDLVMDRFDNDSIADLAVLGTNGQLTVALNRGDNTWRTTWTTNLGLVGANGLATGLFNSDGVMDLVVQGPDGLLLAQGDGHGYFQNLRSIAVGSPGSMAAPGGGRIQFATGVLPGDWYTDVVTVAPGTNEVLVMLGDGQGNFASPVRYASGGTTPIAVTLGNLVGDSLPDLAVGHRDGTVTFLEGKADGTFVLRPSMTISGLGVITGLSSTDLNADGKTDLAVSGTTEANILIHHQDQLTVSPLANGTFSAGLTSWTTTGNVNALGGMAQFREGTGLLSSLEQTFVVPTTGVQHLTFDLASLGLEAATGIPDAFEVSLLGANHQSLVPTWSGNATSFYNANPGGVVHTATGVTIQGQKISVDVSQLAPGTTVRLIFDLVGNPGGNGSVVTIDNVKLDPEVVYNDQYDVFALSGPFTQAVDIEWGDVDGDGRTDIVIPDAATNQVIVFNQNTQGQFVRDPLSVSASPLSVAVGPLTAGDGTSDLAIVLASNVVASPLSGTGVTPAAEPPRIQSLTVTANGLEGQSLTLSASFSDSDGGTPHQAMIEWGDGTSSTGSVTFSNGHGTVASSHIYADNGSYTVKLTLADNTGLADFQSRTVVVNNAAPVVTPAANRTTLINTRLQFDVATFTDVGFTPSSYRTTETYLATINWGDGTPTPFGQLVVTNGQAGSASSGIVKGDHTYALPGVYTVTVNVRDDDGGSTTSQFQVIVAEGQPNWMQISGPSSTNEGSSYQLSLISVLPVSQWVINWGDGQTQNVEGSPSTVSHVFADGAATHLISATAVSGSNVGNDTLVVEVQNVAPTLQLTGANSVAEGTAYQLSLATTDPGQDTITQWVIQWGDGSSDTVNAATASLTHIYADGNANYSISVSATDEDGTYQANKSITVVNVAPQLQISGPASVNEGSLYTLALARLSDPGQDTIQSWTVNWGDGNSNIYTGSPASVTHVYADGLNTYVITATATDEDGTYSANALGITVNNVPRTVTISGASSTNEGAVYTLNLASSDPGLDAVLQWRISWGDGNIQDITGNPGSVSHVFANGPGSYNISAIATDEDGQWVSNTLAVQANNLPPVVLSLGSVSGNEGQSVSLTGTFSDPGSLDTHTPTINWGDGTSSLGSVTVVNGVKTITANHTYADNGVYSVNLTLTDNDGASASASTTATIVNVVPTVTSASNQTATAGTSLSLQLASFTDPGFTFAAAGTQELFTATINWGDSTGTFPASPVVINGAAGTLTVGTVSGSHTYATAGTYTVTVVVSDDDTGSQTKTFQVVVNAAQQGLGCYEMATPVITGITRGTSTGSSSSSTGDTTLILFGTGEPTSVLTISRQGVGSVGTATVGADGNWRFDYTGTALTAGTHTFTATSAAFGPLGQAGDFNAFIFENLSASYTDAQGRVAVGGTATLNGYSVGSSLTNSNRTRDDLIVQGNLNYQNAQVFNGNIAYATTATIAANVGMPRGYPHQDTVLDFAGTRSYLEGRSTAWAGLTPNGTSTFQYGTLTLTGTNPSLNVFLVDGNQLYNANGFNINAPAGSTVLVNITGTTDRIQNMGMNVTGTTRQRVMLNFYQATTLTIQGISIQGSVMAPWAAVNFTNGNLEGQLIAKSVTGPGELHNYLFLHNCPTTSSAAYSVSITPDPADSAATRFYVVSAGATPSTFRYSSSGSAIANNQLITSNSQPRGTTATAANDTTWVLDASGTVFVYDKDGSLRGSWQATGVTNPQDITTDGIDIWVVGTGAVHRFTFGAYRRFGTQAPASSFTLHSNNTQPTGLVTNGTKMWVTDKASGGKVYVYTKAGAYQGVWNLDAANSNPSGITLNPSGGTDLYVVDKTQNKVYTYTNSQSRTSGSQSAASNFLLSTGNGSPEGIGDPIGGHFNFGDFITGEIEVADDEIIYTFDGYEGQLIYLEVFSGDPQLGYSLYDPFNTEILQRFSWESDELYDPQQPEFTALPVTGTYTFIVRSQTGTGITGTFQFKTWDVTDPNVPHTIQIGDTVSDGMPIPPLVYQYSFEATEGQYLFFEAPPNNQAFYFTWTLTDPENNVLFDDPLRDQLTQRMPTTGTYTISVDSDFNYLFTFKVVDITVTSTPISLGDLVTSSINPRGDLDEYTFSGLAGQQIQIEAVNPGSNNSAFVGWEILNDAGDVINDGYLGGSTVITLPDDGDYRFQLHGDYSGSFPNQVSHTGNYQFRINDYDASPPIPIQLDELVSGSFAGGGQQQIYTFTASSGARLFFDDQSQFGVNGLNWKLQAPSNTELFSGFYFDRDTLVITETGTYSLTVYSSAAASYSFVVWDVPATSTTAINLGQTVDASLGVPGEEDLFTFTGSVGQRVYFDVLLNNYQPSDKIGFVVLAPDSSVLLTSFHDDAGTLVLPQAGTYTIRVGQYATSQIDTTGAYRFIVHDVPDTTTESINLNQVYSGSIGTPGQLKEYTFTASAGDRIAVDQFNQISPAYYLYQPDGTPFLSEFGFPILAFDTDTLVLTQTGTYRLVMTTGDYTFEVLTVEQDTSGGALTMGAVNSIDLTRGQRHRLTFDAVAGTKGIFDAISNAGKLEITVTYPNNATGTFLHSDGPVSDILFTYPLTGTYTVTIQGFGNLELRQGNTQFRFLDVPADFSTTIQKNRPWTGTVQPGQKIDYLFTAAQGEELFLDLKSNPALIPLTLIDPDGEILYTTQYPYDYRFTAPKSGTYRLQSFGWDGHPLEGAYQFQVQTVTPPILGVPDHRGTDFMVALHTFFSEAFFPVPNVPVLYLSSPLDTGGYLEAGAHGLKLSFFIPAGQTIAIELPPEMHLGELDGVTNNPGFRITAEHEVTAQISTAQPYSGDATLLMPVDTAGLEYVIPANKGFFTLINTGGAFSVLATQDNTSVTITPSVNANSRLAGVPYTVTLNRGQVYELFVFGNLNNGNYNDISGTIVVADKPVMVESGANVTRIPIDSPAANYIIEQLVPISQWGQRYFFTPFASRTGGDLVRIFAGTNGTEVRIDGNLVATLNRGQYHEVTLTATSEITGNQPIQVSQYATSATAGGQPGDPTLLQVPATRHFQNEYRFFTRPELAQNYLNIVVPTAATSSMQLDGNVVSPAFFYPIAGTGYSYAQLPVAQPGTHRLVSALPFGLSVYGFDTFDAYSYVAGLDFSEQSVATTLDLNPGVVSATLGVPTTLTATVRDSNNAVVAGVPVTFVVTGTHPRTSTVLTDAQGRAILTYSGQLAGSDTVTATAGILSDSSTVSWSAQAPTLTIDQPLAGSSFVAGSLLLLSGRALPGSPLGPITLVTINGQPVEVLDPAGRYFARITLVEGSDTFTVVARDSFGQSVTTSIQLTGTPTTTLDVSQLRDVTTLGQLTYANTTFNRFTRELHADARLVNTGTDAMTGPVIARFDRFTPVSVNLVSSFPSTSDGKRYLTFDDELPSGGLFPNATSSPLHLSFDADSLARFSFDVSLLSYANRAPLFTSTPRTDAMVSRTYNYQTTTSDADLDAIQYSLAIFPAGMTINPTSGLISWTPLSTQVGTHQVEVVASDGRGGSTRQTFTLAVEASTTNRPPVFQSLPLTQAAAGVMYTYQPELLDPDGDTISLSMIASDANIYFFEGVVYFPNAIAGNYLVTLTASDNNGGQAQQQYTLRIGAGQPGAAVAFLSTPPNTTVAGRQFAYQPRIAHTPTGPLTFAVPNAPAGLTVDPDTGLILWVPDTTTQTGPNTITLTASDLVNGGSALQTFTLEVLPAPVNRPPIISSLPPRVATVGQPYLYQPIATDPDGDVLHYRFIFSPPGMGIDQNTGIISWLPNQSPGTWLVSYEAYDDFGGASQQSYILDLRNTNTPPDFVGTPTNSVIAGALYRATVRATDLQDQFLFSIQSGPGQLSVDPRSGVLYWRTTLADVGAHPVTIRVTDDRGLFRDLSYTLDVLPDTIAPQTTLNLNPALINVGETVSISTLATDDNAIVSQSLTLNGNTITLTNGQATYTPTTPGLYSFVFSATDSSGNTGTSTQILRVFNPADTTEPTVIITSPSPGTVVTYLTSIVGTVSDENLEFYRVEVSRAGMNQWRQIAYGTANVTNGTLATFDPTLLENDSYEVRVFAQDINGLSYQIALPLEIQGQAKIGNFRQDFVDLQIPLAGIPITITRTYDTLQADTIGDFGYGWSLSTGYDARIRETVAVTEVGGTLFGATAFKLGTRVYLNTPDGRRVGFTFQPVLSAAGILGAVYAPRFVPDPGVFDKLEVDNVALAQRTDGTYGLYLFGFNYNPNVYRLTTKDNLTYEYDQFTGLQTITDLNNNKLTFTPNGITHNLGQSIQFVRDTVGRITQILDPAGHAINYTYNPAGDLVSQTNQVGLTYSMTYRHDRPHYLESVTDPLGHRALLVNYNTEGRIGSSADALGNTSQNIYDVANFRETVTDPNGGITAYLYDPQGNILAITDQVNQTTTMTYDTSNNKISETNPRNFTTQWTYDARGNITSVTDARNGVSQQTYDQFNNMIQSVDQLNRSVTIRYDGQSRLVEIVDALGHTTGFTNDVNGRPILINDRLGYATTYAYTEYDTPSQVIFSDGGRRLREYHWTGQVKTITDETGNAAIISYDTTGRVTSVVDPLSGVTSFTYQGHRLASKTDPLNHATLYTYDNADRLIREKAPNNADTVYTYDFNGNRIQVTDGRGNFSTYTYRLDNKLIKVEDANNQITRYQYDGAGNQILEIDALGRERRFVYDELNRLTRKDDCPCPDEIYTYDAVGNQTSVTDKLGRVTYFTYDAMNRKVSETDPLNQVTTQTHDAEGRVVSMTDPLLRTSYMAYDSRGREVLRTDALGNQWQMRYDLAGYKVAEVDPLGRVSLTTYDGMGRVLTMTDAIGGVSSIVYDLAGNVKTTINPLGRETHFTYDSMNRLLTTTDAAGGVTSNTYDAVGNRLTSTDQLNHVTTYGYDNLNRMVSVTNALNQTNTYQYDGVGNLIKQTDPRGAVTEMTYDYLNRLKTVKDAAGAIVTYGYDSKGNRTSMTDPLGKVTSFAYDLLDRNISITDPLNHTTTFGYDAVGNRTSTTDALNHTTLMRYDAVNRMIEQEDALGRVTFMTYDSVGNQLSLTDAANQTTSYRYDMLNRVTQETDPRGKERTFGYDANSNRTEAVDRNGRRRTFQYDTLDRMTGETWWNGGTTGTQFTYTYNAVGNRLTANDGTSFYAYGYDNLNRVVQVDNQGTLQSPRVILSYGYDASGNRNSVTDNQGTAVTSNYDLRRLVTVREWTVNSQPVARSEFSYNLRSERTSTQRFDGATQISRSNYTFDDAGRLTEIIHRGAADALFAQYTYGHDAADRITSMSHHGQTETFAYDATNQLIGADSTVQADEFFNYDTVGNRTGAEYATALGNRMERDARFDYTWDDEGNLIQKVERATGNVTTFTWDYRNRLTSMEERSAGGIVLNSVGYIYDVNDNIIRRNTNGTLLYIVYDGQHAWADFDTSGNVTTRYLHGERMDELLARWRPAGGVAWHLADHLGTIRDILDAAGQLINHIDYSAFGMVLAQTNTALGDRFLYTGREYDATTGMAWHRARWYDPSMGRFISQDPIGFRAGDVNWYRYVANMPTSLVDLDGLQIFSQYGVFLREQIARWRIMQCLGTNALATIGQAGVYILMATTMPMVYSSNVYVGRSVDLVVRISSHSATGIHGRQIGTFTYRLIRVADWVMKDRKAFRTVEQIVMDVYGGKGQLLNKINASRRLFCR